MTAKSRFYSILDKKYIYMNKMEFRRQILTNGVGYGNMSESIISGNINNMCHYCGCYVEVPHKHHIFGAANRRWSEKYGLWVWLCPKHHNMSNNSVHHNAEMMEHYHYLGQTAFEKKFIDEHQATQEQARAEFMKIFGRNYL